MPDSFEDTYKNTQNEESRNKNIASGIGFADSEPITEPMRYSQDTQTTCGNFQPDRENRDTKYSNNPYGRFLENDSFVPPSQLTVKPQRPWLTKIILWLTSTAFIAICTFLILTVMNKNNPETNNEKDDSRIPYNGNIETSYAADNSLPDAPEASADPDGPQISTGNPDEKVEGNIANEAFKKASPSVVCITAYPSGTDYTLTQSGEGSGIILSEDGYIATNSHVVNDNMGTGVMVTLNNNTQYLGTLVGIDPKTDLAVIKIAANDLTPADFSNSDSLFVGQEVYAIGNPGGSAFSNSLTRGTVSAIDRILSSNGYVKYIQTDAAINPGNSGGALINSKGEVIGMNTSKLVGTDYEGMGFAIPSNKVADIVNKLIKYGYVNDRGTLGIEGTTCSLYQSRKNNVPQGMVITKINNYSPLFTSQAKEKDIVTAVNDVTVKSSYEFIEQLGKYKPGDTIKLKLFRAPDTASSQVLSFEIEVTLIEDNAS